MKSRLGRTSSAPPDPETAPAPRLSADGDYSICDNGKSILTPEGQP